MTAMATTMNAATAYDGRGGNEDVIWIPQITKQNLAT